MLKKIALGVAALVVLFVLVGLALPSKWHVQRSIAISAAPETITPFIADTRRWSEWAAWNARMDPDAKWTYFVVPDTKLSAMSWKGPKMGTGVLRVVEVTPAKSVRYVMTMEGTLSADGQSMDGGAPANGGFTYSVEGGVTTVTWTDDGDLGGNPIARYFVGSIEKTLSEHFDLGLAALKKAAEEAQAQSDKARAVQEEAAKAAEDAARAADGAPVTAEAK